MEGWIMGCNWDAAATGVQLQTREPCCCFFCVISGHVIDGVGWLFEFLNELLVGQSGPSLIISISPNTLANLSQFFSILSYLKCYRNAFSSSTYVVGNAKPKEQPKKSSKENTVFRTVKRMFKLSNVNYFEIAILRFTNHLLTLKATK